MKPWFALSLLALSSASYADIFSNQAPAANGGNYRWSKLWVDPTGQNNLDGDAICYEDFTLTTTSTINRLEWWGDANPNKGFQIEFWKQDPGTIAYQPYGVFRDSGAKAEKTYITTNYSFNSDPSGTVHFSYDLPTSVTLAANDGANPRWFIAVIGLTDVAYLEWNWAQGLGGSNQTFQFIRGGNEGGGDRYQRLGDGRAMVISGSAVPEPAAIFAFLTGVVAFRRRRNPRKVSA